MSLGGCSPLARGGSHRAWDLSVAAGLVIATSGTRGSGVEASSKIMPRRHLRAVGGRRSACPPASGGGWSIWARIIIRAEVLGIDEIAERIASAVTTFLWRSSRGADFAGGRATPVSGSFWGTPPLYSALERLLNWGSDRRLPGIAGGRRTTVIGRRWVMTQVGAPDGRRSSTPAALQDDRHRGAPIPTCSTRASGTRPAGSSISARCSECRGRCRLRPRPGTVALLDPAEPAPAHGRWDPCSTISYTPSIAVSH